MDFSPQETKKYEETTALIQAELTKQGIPKSVFERVIQIIGEFWNENSELKTKNRTAFLVILLAKVYKAGRESVNHERRA